MISNINPNITDVKTTIKNSVLNNILPSKRNKYSLHFDKKVIVNDEPLVRTVDEEEGIYIYYMGNCIVYRAKRDKKQVPFKYSMLPIDKEYFDNLLIGIKELNRDITTDNKTKLLKTFHDKFKVNFQNLLMYGKTDKIKTSILSFLIPYISYKKRHGSMYEGQLQYAYKSYCCDTEEVNYKNRHQVSEGGGLVIHEDVVSAWKGLLIKAGHPTHALIIKEF